MEIEDRFDNLDRRLDRIEQILPTLATKDDLKAYATKDDLRAYPTKGDLKNELKAFATKDDLAELGNRFLSALAQGFEEAQRHTRELHADLVGKVKVLGEHRPKRR